MWKLWSGWVWWKKVLFADVMLALSGLGTVGIKFAMLKWRAAT